MNIHPYISNELNEGNFMNDDFTFIEEIENPTEEYLVFIIHGIGQTETTLKHILQKIKKTISLLYTNKNKFISKQLHVRMINWKYLIIKDTSKNISKLIDVNNTTKYPKMFINAIPQDILFYLNEKNKFEIISKVVSKKITIKEAMDKLDLTERQIYRLKKIYIEHGEKGFIHKNRGKENPNKINNDLIEKLENLYLEKHYDFNFEHFYEEHVYSKYDISYDTMLKRFTKDDIISPLAHKKTVKLYKDKMKTVIKEDNYDEKEKQIELFKSRIIEAEKAHPRRSSNLYVFGQEVQMDACNKMWFGGIPSFLHLAVDKATKKVLFGWFEYEEITRGYFVLLFNIIINYGIPAKIKADNRSTFSANNVKEKDKKVFMTQFGKVCERLDIVLYTTSVSTAKCKKEGIPPNHILLQASI